MKSIQEYQELSRKPHTAKKYQDYKTHDNSSRGGCSQYRFNTEHRRASTKTHKLDEYDRDMEETIKHSNESKDKRGDKEKKIRGKYMDINETHYGMGHLG
jgi:cell division septum initiation protein DivIVA